MNDFDFTRATDTASALKLISSIPGNNANPARFLAGGTNLIDLIREGIE
jgi:CO/xanthine dehydrogenase FAD-binding subunit